MSNKDSPAGTGPPFIGVKKDGKSCRGRPVRFSLARPSSKNARKVRRLSPGWVLTLFGALPVYADAFTLLKRLEAKLEGDAGSIGAGRVELAKDWRTIIPAKSSKRVLIVTDGRGTAGDHRQRRRAGTRTQRRGHSDRAGNYALADRARG